jgi:hypothetical protein
MNTARALGLFRQTHRRCGMTVAALQRIVRLQPCPFVFGKLQAVIKEFGSPAESVGGSG